MGAGSTPAGWYPDVERPGGERFWDGTAWTEQRRTGASPPPAFDSNPSGGQPPWTPPQSGYAPPGTGQAPQGNPPRTGVPQPGGPAPSPYGYQPYGAVTGRDQKNAIAGWGLGLSIAGLVLICCGGILLSVPGTIMGWTQMKAVDRGDRDSASRGTAKAAFVVGIVGVGVFVAFIAVYLIALIVGAS